MTVSPNSGALPFAPRPSSQGQTMPYPSLQRALDAFLAKMVSEYGEAAVMRLIASNQRTEVVEKPVPIPVDKEPIE